MAKEVFYYNGKVPYEDITLDNICGFEHKDEGNYSVTNWFPRREEIERIVRFSEAISDHNKQPVILDIGCGNGFISYLLAKTDKAHVIGIDPDAETLTNSPYKHANLEFIIGNSELAKEFFSNEFVDVVFNSWMPQGINLTPDMRNVGANGIVYVLDKSGTTGQPYKPFFRKPDNIVSYHPGNDYQKIASWNGVENKEKMHALLGSKGMRKFKSLRYYAPKQNQIQFQLKKNVEMPDLQQIEEQAKGFEPYHWEERANELFGEVEPISYR